MTADPGDEAEPSFSIDGGSLVFSKRETGGIYVVGALGGPPRLVVGAARARTPRFSPDGRWIAYWTGLPVAISRAAGASGSLFVIPATGGSPRQVASGFASARHPVWSPDGRRLLFLGARSPLDGDLDWYVTGLDDSEAIKTGAFQALRDAGAASLRELPIPSAWTAPGHDVLAATTAAASANIWQLAVSPDTGALLGSPRRLTFVQQSSGRRRRRRVASHLPARWRTSISGASRSRRPPAWRTARWSVSPTTPAWICC